MPQVLGYAAKHSFSSLKPLEIDRREPEGKDVEIEILFCGVCHSDIHQVKNEWHNTVYPCLPGHEIVGRVTRLGAEATKYKVGEMVAVGCMVDSCGQCRSCKGGEEQYCEKGFLATYNGPMKPDGSNTFGGYSKSIVVTEGFVLKLPEGMDPAKSAPLLCAGVTTYSPMKHWKVAKGQRVGIVGFGGLGHVATQIARALGAVVTVFTTTPEKTEDAKRLGATEVVLSTEAAAMEHHAGTFDFLLSTIPEAHDVNPYVATLKHDGVFCAVGALEPYAKPTDNSKVAFQRLSVAGSLIGSIAETQEILDFCAEHRIEAQAEIIPIEQINDAFSRVEDKQVRYRYVIDMSTLKEEKK